MKKILILFSTIILLLTGCFKKVNKLDNPTPTPTATIETVKPTSTPEESPSTTISEDGYYTSKDEVALYIYTYNKLPGNYLSKDEAKSLGWVASKENLWKVTDQMSIGGDQFYNREKLLPVKEGRIWYECDIDYEGKGRNAKRIVFSNDGLIYYTDDHYKTFELLYGGPEE